MIDQKAIATSSRFLRQITGSTIEYDLTPYRPIVASIRSVEAQYQNLSQHELNNKSEYLRSSAKKDTPLDDLLIETFALVSIFVRRTLAIDPFDEQLIGGILLHQGKIVEMQTGEGKTLTATFPICLNALSGSGVHLLTFNDYLAARDANWMEPIYEAFGLSIGYIQENMSILDRQKAYQADITYLTAKEAGFDYLRDSLRNDLSEGVHHQFNMAIVDEADSIMIDEARIPLIIAGSVSGEISNTSRTATIAHHLVRGIDIELDETARNVQLTDTGIETVEKQLGIADLYAEENLELLIRIQNAIHVEFLLTRDVDYIVRAGKIELVDELTGRVAVNRRWPDEIQAALEAKEHVTVQKSGKILNSITLQHFIQQYQNIAGMTATAQSAEGEFWNVYQCSIGVVPPHHPCIRCDHDDLIFATKIQKKRALVNEIIQVHETGRPILVGTRSVGESTDLARELSQIGIRCQVLNAKEDAYEAKIIAQAGRLKAVTISTNMAGRGVDIHLGGMDAMENQAVKQRGGLYVIGTNRHESQRIDHQLRGRAGRQGDPGASRYFISLEDDLFEKFHIKTFIRQHLLGARKNGAINHPLMRSEITKFQLYIEQQHQDIKMSLLRYSHIINGQREIILADRMKILNGQYAVDYLKKTAPQNYNKIIEKLEQQQLEQLCRSIFLGVIDQYWSDYLALINEIREGIHLRSYASNTLAYQPPLLEFQKTAIALFDELREKIDQESQRVFNSLDIRKNLARQVAETVKKPSNTWTYTIGDGFSRFASSMTIGIGVSAVLAIYWPIIYSMALLNRIFKLAVPKKLISRCCSFFRRA